MILVNCFLKSKHIKIKRFVTAVENSMPFNLKDIQL